MPSVGSRVALRYRIPEGLTDVIGHLEALTPQVVVRTKSDGAIEIDPADVVSVRELSDVPVRNSEIRAVEHAAALACPGTEQHWLDGWLLRASPASATSMCANSAVPLEFSANMTALPGIITWYAERGLPPWLLLPERLLPVRAAGVQPGRVLTRELTHGPDVASPEAADVAEVAEAADVAEAAEGAEGDAAAVTGSASGRVAMTSSPDGTRWAGLTDVQVSEPQRRDGRARVVCTALLTWAANHGATRAYVQVPDDNLAAITLAEALGFRLHHRYRFVSATDLL